MIDLQNDITKNYKKIIGLVNKAIEWAVTNDMHVIYIRHYNLVKAGYKVHVISDCVTSYDLKKMDEMLKYYADKGCEVLMIEECMGEKEV